MSLLGRCLVAFGIISLAHAGYSAIQFKTYLKLTEEEFGNLPIDIIAQVMIGLIVSVFGIVRVAGELKDVHAAAELAHKSWETFEVWVSATFFWQMVGILSKGILPAFNDQDLRRGSNANFASNSLIRKRK